MNPFDECPECEADGDWCEDGCCVRCGYDVLADSDLADVEEGQCYHCGDDLQEQDEEDGECGHCGASL